MNPIALLNTHLPQLTKSERLAAEYIILNPISVARYTLTDIAKISGSSNAAIIRLCKKIGYEGYSEFKFSMSKHLLSNDPPETNTEEKNAIKEITNNYIKYISQIPNYIEESELYKLAETIHKANHISVWGVNRTSLSSNQLVNRLTRMGIASNSISDIVQMSDYSSILKSGDLCILFSISGKGSPLYPEMFKQLNERKCSTVLITMTPNLKSISKYADIVITLPNIEQSGSNNFYDDQAIFLVFIEILLHEVATLYQNQ